MILCFLLGTGLEETKDLGIYDIPEYEHVDKRFTAQVYEDFKTQRCEV